MRAHHRIPSFWIAAGLVSFLVASGCRTSPHEAAQATGRYDVVVHAPPPQATRATTDVLEGDYLFKIESSAFTNADGNVEAQSAQGTRVWARVEGRGDGDSVVSIRVGSGDEKLSLEILDKIKDRARTIMERIRAKM
jgi:hypothetical protein